MKIDLTDKLSNDMYGQLTVSVTNHETGEVVDSYTEKNIIVQDAKEAIIRSIASSVFGHVDGIKIGDDIGNQVAMAGTPNLTFADANPDTITRDAGSWITDGFIDDMTLTITGSTSNDGTYTIDTGGVGATVLTLIATDTLAVEGPTGSIALTGDPALTNPRPALDSYNETTMTEIFDTKSIPYAISTTFPDAVTVIFSVTIIGQDVMDLFPADTSKIITSAALHTNNLNVFAYKRFPQKSISALLDLNIVWQVGY